jgi:hypothetical protein
VNSLVSVLQTGLLSLSRVALNAGKVKYTAGPFGRFICIGSFKATLIQVPCLSIFSESEETKLTLSVLNDAGSPNKVALNSAYVPVQTAFSSARFCLFVVMTANGCKLGGFSVPSALVVCI